MMEKIQDVTNQLENQILATAEKNFFCMCMYMWSVWGILCVIYIHGICICSWAYVCTRMWKPNGNV